MTAAALLRLFCFNFLTKKSGGPTGHSGRQSRTYEYQ